MNRRQLITTGIGAALLRFLPAWGSTEVVHRQLQWQKLLTSCGFEEVPLANSELRAAKDGAFLIPPELMQEIFVQLRMSSALEPFRE